MSAAANVTSANNSELPTHRVASTAAVASPISGQSSSTASPDVSQQRQGQATSSRKPKLYETDERKYAGPHRWQVRPWANLSRRMLRRHAYTRWVEEAFSEVRVAGQELLADLDGPALFVGNHASHLDTLLIHAGLPEHIRRRIYFGAAQDRWFVKGKKKLVLKPWYQSLALGNFPIKRGGGAQALDHARWLLEQGQHVFLFPEGTRATGDELGQFKHGASILALECQVPVVPLYLVGLDQLRPKGAQRAKRGVGAMEILPPVSFYSGTDTAVATRTLEERLGAVHRRYRAAAASNELDLEIASLSHAA